MWPFSRAVEKLRWRGKSLGAEVFRGEGVFGVLRPARSRYVVVESNTRVWISHAFSKYQISHALSSADGRSLVNNCKIDTEGDLVMNRNVPALSPIVPAHHAAILVDYGEAYWDWSPAIVGS